MPRPGPGLERGCAVGFGFQWEETAALELDRDAAALYAGDVSHTPVGKRLVGIVHDSEFADYLIADRELNRLVEVQEDAASTHIRGNGADGSAILAYLDGCAGCDQKAQFSSLIGLILLEMTGFHEFIAPSEEGHFQSRGSAR
jgi:hypothetical protein